MDIRTLCLGALALGEASGYEIKKLFESAFSHFQGAGFGSIYPALGRLAEEGLVSHREVQEARHPTKRLFRLTEAGRERLQAALDTTAPSERYRSDFLVLLFFAHLMSTERLAAVLDEQAANLRGELATLEQIARTEPLTPGMRFTVEFGQAAKSARLAFIEDHRDALLAEHAATPKDDHA